MFNFLSKPKIEFCCLIPELVDVMPVVESKKVRYGWAAKAREYFAGQLKDAEEGTKLRSITKCPGIFQLTHHGFILRAWQDTVIETFGDGMSFNWESMLNQQALIAAAQPTSYASGPSIGVHDYESFAKFIPQRSDTLDVLVKYTTPWRVKIPKGYLLLEMPIPYPDHANFTACHGFLNSDYGTVDLNPQLMWHVRQGRVVIKAGTPITQYILVKNNIDVKFNVRPITNNDIYRGNMSTITSGNQYITSPAKYRDIFKQENE
jgi:hypothetical protein